MVAELPRPVLCRSIEPSYPPLPMEVPTAHAVVTCAARPQLPVALCRTIVFIGYKFVLSVALSPDRSPDNYTWQLVVSVRRPCSTEHPSVPHT